MPHSTSGMRRIAGPARRQTMTSGLLLKYWAFNSNWKFLGGLCSELSRDSVGMGVAMTARSLCSRHSLLLSVLTATVFLFLLVTVEAADPESSPRRASAVPATPSEPRDSNEAPEPSSEYDNRSFRSGPPDTTPYSRPIVPEDLEPQGKPAIPPNIKVPPPNRPDRKQTSESEDGGRLSSQ